MRRKRRRRRRRSRRRSRRRDKENKYLLTAGCLLQIIIKSVNKQCLGV